MSLAGKIVAWLARPLKMLSAVPSAVTGGGGWFNIIREPFGGAWQRNLEVDSRQQVLAFSAVFSCVTIIASDIAKLRIKLVEEDEDGICTELKTSPFAPVLRKPNRYQTRIKFVEQWIVSKLLYGNAYALKVRDGRGIVTQLYILDAQRVTPLVADNGDVYYQLSTDHLSGLTGSVTVPASEIIHDTMVCLWHPLVGVSPIYACGISATQGGRIQANSTKFFDNMSRPSGILTAPGPISDETANRLAEKWNTNYGGANSGRTAIVGDGLKYEAMAIPALEAQLIEQLRWTVEDIGRCFHVPNYKLGGPVPPNNTIDALSQAYYSDCLQALIESFELCMDEGLALPNGYYTELDLDGLLRMDQAAQIIMLSESVKGSIRSPNEARNKLNLKPVAGGDSPMAQQQNFSLAALAKRDALPNPFAIARPTANTTPSDAESAAPADPNVKAMKAEDIESQVETDLWMELKAA